MNNLVLIKETRKYTGEEVFYLEDTDFFYPENSSHLKTEICDFNPSDEVIARYSA